MISYEYYYEIPANAAIVLQTRAHTHMHTVRIRGCSFTGYGARMGS